MKVKVTHDNTRQAAAMTPLSDREERELKRLLLIRGNLIAIITKLLQQCDATTARLIQARLQEMESRFQNEMPLAASVLREMNSQRRATG